MAHLTRGNNSPLLEFTKATDFGKFLSDRTLLDMAMGVAVGMYANEFSTEIVDIFIQPVIQRFTTENKKLAQFTIKIGTVDFEIGRLVFLLLKFVIIAFTIYSIFVLLPNKLNSWSVSK